MGFNTTVIVPLTKDHIKKYSNEFSFDAEFEVGNNKFKNRIIINTCNNSWIGYIGINKAKKEITILEVNKKYLRMGFGTLLLKQFPEARILYTESANKKSLAFYTKNGWKDSGKKYRRNNNEWIILNNETNRIL